MQYGDVATTTTQSTFSQLLFNRTFVYIVNVAKAGFWKNRLEVVIIELL